MRHFLLSGAIALHALGMGEASAATALVASTSRPSRCKSNQCRTGAGAINLTAVAVAADAYLHAAMSAQKESAHGIHRLAPASRSDMIDRKSVPWNNLPAHVPSTLWGTTSGKLGGFGRCRAGSVRHLIFIACCAVLSFSRCDQLNTADAPTRHSTCGQTVHIAARPCG